MRARSRRLRQPSGYSTDKFLQLRDNEGRQVGLTIGCFAIRGLELRLELGGFSARGDEGNVVVLGLLECLRPFDCSAVEVGIRCLAELAA